MREGGRGGGGRREGEEREEREREREREREGERERERESERARENEQRKKRCCKKRCCKKRCCKKRCCCLLLLAVACWYRLRVLEEIAPEPLLVVHFQPCVWAACERFEVAGYVTPDPTEHLLDVARLGGGRGGGICLEGGGVI
jgi:hypothetical protein